MRDLIFIGFCLFTLACASGVVLAKSAVYSAFSLILSFFGLAGLYLLWGSPFLAVVQILIYTGAIVVLFVFVVMLLNQTKRVQHSHSWLTIGVSSVLAWLFSLLLLRTLTVGEFAGNHPVAESNMRVISKLLFNQYLWPFEILSIFLLAMIVGIFVLTRGDKEEAN